ncbi:MAG: hypothetical protein P1U39_02570 [Legionellaceae bacterium]|nr:hypothetical protein [Legionellaceae bacterium]
MNILRNTRAVISTVAFLSLSIAHAGDMGSKPAPVSMPYIGGEVSYNWMQRDNPNINGFSPRSSIQHWGGRVSAGMLKFYNEKLRFTGEIGGGFYGNESTKIPQLSVKEKQSVDGYDVLVGALYKLEKVDVFGQVGFMVQNLRMSLNQANLSEVSQGTFLTGTSYQRDNKAAVLPELRVGGIYNLREDLGITLTYMHAFGSTLSNTFSMVAAPGNIHATQVAKMQNPSLDSILLGLRYYIV